jgi:hypothetical protein
MFRQNFEQFHDQVHPAVRDAGPAGPAGPAGSAR